jgi:hypothetical protein
LSSCIDIPATGETEMARQQNHDSERAPDAAPPSNLQKDPDEWVTGDERMTDAQASYLKTLSDEARQPFDPNLSKAEASKRIDALQEVTGRGRPADKPDS